MARGNTAERIEDYEFDPDLVQDFVEGKNDAKGTQEIKDIRDDLMNQLQKAKIGGLSEKDFQKFEDEIKSNGRDTQAMFRLGHELRATVAENKTLLDNFVKTIEQEKDVDQKMVVKNQIELFKQFSLEEKRAYLKGIANEQNSLRSKLDFVDKLYQEVVKYAPDQLQDFRRLNTVKDKKELVTKIESTREKNIETYRKLIEANREQFSVESGKEYMDKFKEQSLKEQTRWIREFNGEVARKNGVTKQFKAFPEAIRKKFESKFKSARRKERAIILQDMERAFEEEHLHILNADPNARHFSETDRAENKELWGKASMEVRTLMMKSLPDHLKRMAEMSKKYEELPAEIKLEIQEKQGFQNFYKLGFEAKDNAVKEGAKLKASAEKKTGEYGAKLADAVSKKYMSKATREAFMKEFKDLDDEGKSDWINKFGTHELPKRKEVTDRFQKEVTPELQNQNVNFYELGYSERVKLLAKLLNKDENEIHNEIDEVTPPPESAENVETMMMDAMRLEREGNMAENQETKKEKWCQAMDMYRGVLKMDAADDIARSNLARLTAKYRDAFGEDALPGTLDEASGLNRDEIDHALATARQSSVMKDEMKRHTVAEDLINLAARSELLNNNAYDSGKRMGHLDEADRSLQKALLDQTDGKMVIGTDGMAKKRTKVDVKKKVDAQSAYNLQRVATKNRGEKGKNVNYVEIYNEETGQLQNANTGRLQIEKEKTRLQNEFVLRAAKSLEARGIKLSQADLEAMREAAANDNMRVQIQEAS